MQKRMLRIVLFITLIGLLLIPQTQPVRATVVKLSPPVFVVNSTQDSVDANPGDGVCAASNGTCTLRAAIQEGASNLSAVIQFNISGSGARIIYIMGSILPNLRNDVIGPNNDGAEIVLDGTNDGITPISRALNIDTDGVTVSGLTIQNFGRTGIVAAGDNVQIGGVTAQEANVLCNSDYGIEDNSDTVGTLIYGNYIGVRKNGTTCPNTYGISVSGQNTIIGGAATGQRNIIGGNNYGVYVHYNAVNTSIKGNFIGLGPTGNSVVPNTNYGIYVYGGTTATVSTNTTIGGTLANEGNYIAGNGQMGIRINYGSVGTLIQGNRIGMNIFNSAHLPNGMGIYIGSSNVTIGGSAAAANWSLDRFEINRGTATSEISNITVSDNYIGVTPDFIYRTTSDLDGIKIFQAFDTSIQRNYISHFNTGVNVYQAGGYGHKIIRNRIWGNTSLGIDLNNDGVTLNDPLDADIGPNDLQNFPVITGFTNTSNVILTLTGTLHSEANKSYNIYIYSNPTCDENGYGEGRYFLHNVVAITNASGDATWTSNIIPMNDLEGICYTAQAEEAVSLGSVSEFSKGFLAGWQIYLPMVKK
jgi:CSLREA domain-containing protein